MEPTVSHSLPFGLNNAQQSSGYVIITGATQGIGAACLQFCVAAGYSVIFCGRDYEAGKALEAAYPGSYFLVADLAIDAQREAFVADALRISGERLVGLVNNAGVSARESFESTNAALCDRVYGLNLRVPTLLTAAFMPALRSGKGSIVMMSSIAGKTGEQGLALYTASKAGLIGLTEALALEVGPEVRVNAICPGQIETAMMGKTLSIPGRRDALVKRIPMKRMGRPEDVAEAVLWLLSSNSSFITGTTITVDGGETSGLMNL